jgi:hypothetical protein
MSEASMTRPRSPLELGALALAALGLPPWPGSSPCSSRQRALRIHDGFGIAFAILLAGGAIAAAVACLARGRAEAVTLAGPDS